MKKEYLREGDVVYVSYGRNMHKARVFSNFNGTVWVKLKFYRFIINLDNRDWFLVRHAKKFGPFTY